MSVYRISCLLLIWKLSGLNLVRLHWPITTSSHILPNSLRIITNIYYYYLQILAGIAQWYSVGLRAGLPTVRARQGLRIFLFTTASRPALEPTQPPIQWVPVALSLGVKRPVGEADHSLLSSAEVKNSLRYTSTPPIYLHVLVLRLRMGLYLHL
jgi:hypothetical protein